LAWRQALSGLFHRDQTHLHYMSQILGFGADGHPILANFQLNTAEAQSGVDKTAFAPTTARREKLTWDHISESSAKIVSFIGK
jgi:hypothetical protein